MTSKLFSILVVLAVVSIVGTIGYVTSHRSSADPTQPLHDPPTSPTANRVAGSGVVEAATRNIDIGVSASGVVTEIPVKPGQTLKKGDTLLKLDTREAEATVAVQQAALRVAEQQLAELKAQPRPEDVPIAESAVRSAEALIQQQQKRLERARKLDGQKVISAEDLEAIIEAETVAREQLASAKAELTKLNAGAWAPQIAVAESHIAQAEAALNQAQTTVSLRTVTAPTNGNVLQINVEAGEFVVAGPGSSVMVFGDTSELHVRVDVDEVDIPRFEQAKTATAFRRGDAKTAIPLTLLRIEPLVIPKQTLTGELQERTDTRVLQAVFKVDAVDKLPTLYVGQQLDVFAATKP